MKRLIISVAIFGAVLMGVGVFSVPGKAAAAGKERALVEFTEMVKLRDVFLRGRYLVVHDEDRMAKGEPCLSIYRGVAENPENLVVAYHCRHVDRAKADRFQVLVSRVRWFEVPEVTEIQFRGSSDGHQVPF